MNQMELEQRLGNMLRGLNKGRAQAHANRRAEQISKDQRMRNFWQSCKAAGWGDDEILHGYAMRCGVQRDTARRRAKRLQLLSDG